MADETPELHTLTPSLTVRGCAEAIAFYQRALGAQVVMRFDSPDGKSVWHAHLRIGDSDLFLGDEMPGQGPPAPSAEKPAPGTLWVSSPNCDAAYRKAVDAGAKSTMAPEDMFWGDRVGSVTDPFGYSWSFAQHVKDVSPEEMKRAGEAFAREMAAGKKG